ncbi:transmembrane protein, putative [Medicago truncatula]|uniref:Transmembrane protein, putative n=1 Tax=Medicago truncatula TaxID=3880 RepID=G7J0N9_MEDTR|nr:transmembrane protein, putative [Medicago truncatula]
MANRNMEALFSYNCLIGVVILPNMFAQDFCDQISRYATLADPSVSREVQFVLGSVLQNFGYAALIFTFIKDNNFP